MARQAFDLEALEQYFKDKGMRARFWQDQAGRMLHVLVKPDIGQARSLRYFPRLQTETTPAPWHRCWWARLLRWIHQKRLCLLGKWLWPYTKPFRWIRKWTQFPYWLIELIFANQVKLSQEIETLPEDILDRIQAMQYYLRGRNIKPTKVIIGAKAMAELQVKVMFGYTSYPLSDMLMNAPPSIFGLEIQVNPFLAEDAVIVC